jgi:predicted nucleic-acid-binding protein
MAVAVDGSVLARYFTKDDTALAREASSILDQAKVASLLLDRLVIAELGYVLWSVYKLSKEDVVTIYRSLLASDCFTIPDREVVEVAVDIFASERPLSFEDSWLLALRRSGRATQVASFDLALRRRLGKDT